MSWEKWLEQDDVLPAEDASAAPAGKAERVLADGRTALPAGLAPFRRALPGREPVRELLGDGLAYARGGRTILDDVAVAAFAGEPSR